ncbi:MAG: TraR/DksA C4-type zinc finger protein [Pseudomonadota bacterium]|nr:TraR/DksA C4-type zinc finger protein [Pseudomonadota bacterium]
MPDLLDKVDDTLGQQADDLAAKLRADRQARERLPGTEFCIDCEEPIPAARRLALPHARRCIECQEFSDRYGV